MGARPKIEADRIHSPRNSAAPIFVYEKEDSTWELIDGLQRVSTILEFMGLLKGADTGTVKPPSYMTSTKYLSLLNNAVWEKSSDIADISLDSQVELDKSQQLAIRRARLGVEILKRPSDSRTKYDLFQRLNAGGTPANSQELRNCIIIMISQSYFDFVKLLADHDSFLKVLAASDDQIERQRHMEYVSRFLVYTYIPYDGKHDNDLVYINPADLERPIGFNPLSHVPDDLKPIASDGIVSAFRHVWPDSWGPRLDYILTNAVRALLDVPGATLLMLPRLLIDKPFAFG
jgi:hypothetical protein